MQLNPVPGKFYHATRSSRITLFPCSRRNSFRYAIVVAGRNCEAELSIDEGNRIAQLRSKVATSWPNDYDQRLLSALTVHLKLLEIGINAPIIISGGISKRKLGSIQSALDPSKNRVASSIYDRNLKVLVGSLSEADAGARFLLSHCEQNGIAPPALVLEHCALDSVGNGIFTKQVVDSLGLFSGLREIILVSSPDQMVRLGTIFKHCFIGQSKHSIEVHPAIMEEHNPLDAKKLAELGREFIGQTTPADLFSLLSYLRNVHPLYDRTNQGYVRAAVRRTGGEPVSLPTEMRALELASAALASFADVKPNPRLAIAKPTIQHRELGTRVIPRPLREFLL